MHAKFWAGSKFTWGYANTADPKNECLEVSYKLSVCADTNRFRNLVICPFDHPAATAIAVASKNLEFDKFEVPFYIGKKSSASDLKTILGYIWTGSEGGFRAYNPEGAATKAMGEDASGTGTKCALTTGSTVVAMKGVA